MVVSKDAVYAATTDSAWGQETGWFVEATRHTTPSYTLDRLLEKEVVPRIDFLKMDIENSFIKTAFGPPRPFMLYASCPTGG